MIEILDRCRNGRLPYAKVKKQIFPALYYQDGKRLTLAAADREAITEWMGEYLVSGSAPFPLSGEIPAANYKFVIGYNTDVELVDNRDLKDPDEMAKYNHETNAVRNKEKGKNRVAARASKTLPDGDFTRDDLKALGYGPKAISNLLRDGLMIDTKRRTPERKFIYRKNFK